MQSWTPTTTCTFKAMADLCVLPTGYNEISHRHLCLNKFIKVVHPTYEKVWTILTMGLKDITESKLFTPHLAAPSFCTYLIVWTSHQYGIGNVLQYSLFGHFLFLFFFIFTNLLHCLQCRALLKIVWLFIFKFITNSIMYLQINQGFYPQNQVICCFSSFPHHEKCG